MKKVMVSLFCITLLFANVNLVKAATSYSKVSCNGVDIPAIFPSLVSTGIKIIEFGVPILLIIFGMLDFGRAVMAQKEDEIKKGQQMFIKRLIAGAMVFLVVFVVQIVITLVSKSAGDDSVWDCVSCFINNECNK